MKIIHFVLFCFTTSLISNLVHSSQRCQLAPNWLVNDRNPIIENAAGGNVVVLSLVSSKSRQFLLHTLDALNNYGRHYSYTVKEKVKIIVINGQGGKLPTRLIGRFPYITIYEEPEDKQIFKKLKGQAWDVLVYDVCGRMQFRYVYPYSWLGFPFLSRAINYAIGKYEHVCGACKPLSEYRQLPARFPPTLSSSHIPAEVVVAITANNDLAEGLRVTKVATTQKSESSIGKQEELYQEEVDRETTVVIEKPHEKPYEGLPSTAKTTIRKTLKPTEIPYNTKIAITSTLRSVKPSETPSTVGYKTTLVTTRQTTQKSLKPSETPSNDGNKSTLFTTRQTTQKSLKPSETPSNFGHKSTLATTRKTTQKLLETSVVPSEEVYGSTTQEPIHESTKESEEPPYDVTTTLSTLESFVSSDELYDEVYWSTTEEPTTSYERLRDSTTKKSLKKMVKPIGKKFEGLNGNTTREITQKPPTESIKLDNISLDTKVEVPQGSTRPANDPHKAVKSSTAEESTLKMFKTNDEQAHMNYTTEKPSTSSLNQTYDPYQRAHGIPIFIDKEKFKTRNKIQSEFIGTPVPVTTKRSTVDPRDVKNFIVSRLNKFLHTKYNAIVTTPPLDTEEGGTSTEFSTDSSDANTSPVMKPTNSVPVKGQKDELDQQIIDENRKLKKQIDKAEHLINPKSVSDDLLLDYILQNVASSYKK